MGRDPRYCFERLYPKHKVDSFYNSKRPGLENQSIEDINNNEDLNNAEQRIYRKNKVKVFEDYDFKPMISFRSKTLAEKQGPSSQRILSVKENKNKDVDKNIGKIKYFLCDDKPIKKERTSKSTNKIANSNYLYEQAEKLKKRREDKITKEKEIQENYLKETVTFRPSISEGTNKENVKVINKPNSQETFFNRQERWKRGLYTKNEKIKEYFVHMELEKCTFKPNIKSINIPDDEKFIKRNLDQIMSYVVHRQKNLYKHHEQECYENKKFFKSSNFVIRPTVCKEFKFNSSKRKKMKSLNTFRNKTKEEEMLSKHMWQDWSYDISNINKNVDKYKNINSNDNDVLQVNI